MMKSRLACFDRNRGEFVQGLLTLSVLSFLVALNLTEARDPTRVRDPKPVIHDVFVMYDEAPGTGMTLDIYRSGLCLFPVDLLTELPDTRLSCINPTVELRGAAISVVGPAIPGHIEAHYPAVIDGSFLLKVVHGEDSVFEVTFGADGATGPIGNWVQTPRCYG